MSQRSDAASDRCSYVTAAPPAPATAFTVVFWARLRVDQDDFSTMMRLHSTAGSNTAINITTGSSGTTPIVVSPGNTSGIVGTDALAVDTWRMIAVTCAGTGATDSKIYTRTVGGSTNVVSGQVSGGATPDGVTLFGRSIGDSSEWFNGGLAYVRMWSAVLSQSEVEAEWASATVVRTSGLWANWPMVSGIGDISGNGRDLVAGATALSTEDDPPLGVSGTASGVLGALSATASGVPTTFGTAASSLGGLTATASGVPTTFGVAAAQLGGLAATALGVPTTFGVANASLGGLAATASGTSSTPNVLGTANAVLGGLVATIAGRVSLRGSASAVLGGLVASAVVVSPAPASTPGRGWGALLSISKEFREYRELDRATTPVACPRDGNPLEGAPDGGLFCRACGWRPDELTGELRP